jgi:hypothetical protein
LDKQIQELREQSQSDKETHDRELADLREEKAKLQDILQNARNQIAALTQQRDNRPNITLDQ